MNALSVDHVEFRIFAALCAVLILKNLGLALATGTARGVYRAWASEEDVRLAGGSTAPNERVERIRRAHGNALENDPLFMMLGLLYLLVGAGETGMQAYGYTFVIARYVHAASYVVAIQPFRTLSFGVGVLCCVGMAVQILMKAFG